MARFTVIVSDPPWQMSDPLTMSDVKRGAASNYPVLDIAAIKHLEVERLAAKDSVLALWVPSSILQDGLDTMKNWGYEHKQTVIWVKTKRDPLKRLLPRKLRSEGTGVNEPTIEVRRLRKVAQQFDLNTILDFNLGRLFRQTHEICLLGTRGKIYGKMQNRSQRSVHFHHNLKHSQKPEFLQDQLDIVFPRVKKLELFARRDRKGWICAGLECPSTIGEDIRDTIQRLAR